MNSFDQIESTFIRIDNQIKSFHVKINEPKYSYGTISKSINDVRDGYLAIIKKHCDKSLLKAKNSYSHDLVDLVDIEFKQSVVKISDIPFHKFQFTADFSLSNKLKYSHLFQDNHTITRIDEKFGQRSKWTLKQLTSNKILIHSKSTNSVYLFANKSNSYSILLNKLKFNEEYYLTFHVYNAQLILTLTRANENIIQVYSEFLHLKQSRSFDDKINIVCLNDNEIIYWSPNDRYSFLDYNLKKMPLDLNYNLISGAIMHISADRVYFTNDSSMIILTRGINGQLTGSIPLDLQTSCMKVDSDSNVFIKTRGKKVTCHDKNGQLVCANYLNGHLNLYDYFYFLDRYFFSFIDFKQINSIVF